MGQRQKLSTKRRHSRPGEQMGFHKGFGSSIREDPSKLQIKLSRKPRYWISSAGSLGGYSTPGSALQPSCFLHVLPLHLLLNSWRMDPGFKDLCSKLGNLFCPCRKNLQHHHFQPLAISGTELSNFLHRYPLYCQAPSQSWLDFWFYGVCFFTFFYSWPSVKLYQSFITTAVRRLLPISNLNIWLVSL